MSANFTSKLKHCAHLTASCLHICGWYLLFSIQICTFEGAMFAHMWLFAHLRVRCLHKCGSLHISRLHNPVPLGALFEQLFEQHCLNNTVWQQASLVEAHLGHLKKAGQRLGALRKIANKLDTAGRATVYKAQIRSIKEYACLSWMSASPTVLNQLDSIQQKALRIIGVDQVTACRELAITSLHFRREVAAVSVHYKMHTSHCPRDLQAVLPNPVHIPQNNSMPAHAMPDHAVATPPAKTSTLDRTFLHSAIRIWNSLPDTVVGQNKEWQCPIFQTTS